MKNIYKKIVALLYDVPIQKETHKFYPMTVFPPQESNDSFSILVLVYDESDSRYFDIGYYDFEKESWSVFGEESMNLKCWCYVPDPSSYWKKKDMLSLVLLNESVF